MLNQVVEKRFVGDFNEAEWNNLAPEAQESILTDTITLQFYVPGKESAVRNCILIIPAFPNLKHSRAIMRVLYSIIVGTEPILGIPDNTNLAHSIFPLVTEFQTLQPIAMSILKDMLLAQELDWLIPAEN